MVFGSYFRSIKSFNPLANQKPSCACFDQWKADMGRHPSDYKTQLDICCLVSQLCLGRVRGHCDGQSWVTCVILGPEEGWSLLWNCEMSWIRKIQPYHCILTAMKQNHLTVWMSMHLVSYSHRDYGCCVSITDCNYVLMSLKPKYCLSYNFGVSNFTDICIFC